MSTFFSKFPKINLKLHKDDNSVISYTDIFRFIDVNDAILTNYANYEWYEISDGDRPDIVSQRLYDTPAFYWTFFIVNDRLKDGLKAWPLSQQSLDKFISEKYDDYGVATVYPFYLMSGSNDFLSLNWNLDMMGFDFDIDLMNDIETPLAISNFLHGLELDYPHLRARRLYSDFPGLQDGTNGTRDQTHPSFVRGYATIKEFDSQRYQIWFQDVTDSFFFREAPENGVEGNEIQLVLFNPFEEGTDEYEEREVDNAAWIERQREWYTQFFGTYLGDESAFGSELISKLRFYVTRFYETAAIAPHHFISGSTGEKLDNLLATYAETAIPVPNFEVERELNDAKRFIRVLKPSVIYRFADKYQKLLDASERLDIA